MKRRRTGTFHGLLWDPRVDDALVTDLETMDYQIFGLECP